MAGSRPIDKRTHSERAEWRRGIVIRPSFYLSVSYLTRFDRPRQLYIVSGSGVAFRTEEP
jgi:hypothetical protein